ncbi:MAG: hypothetical protein AB7H97_02085 [Pseudobdellovibrionaceae bacterium]
MNNLIISFDFTSPPPLEPKFETQEIILALAEHTFREGDENTLGYEYEALDIYDQSSWDLKAFFERDPTNPCSDLRCQPHLGKIRDPITAVACFTGVLRRINWALENGISQTESFSDVRLVVSGAIPDTDTPAAIAEQLSQLSFNSVFRPEASELRNSTTIEFQSHPRNIRLINASEGPTWDDFIHEVKEKIPPQNNIEFTHLEALTLQALQEAILTRPQG